MQYCIDTIKRDAGLFGDMNLMDYSLIVTVMKVPESDYTPSTFPSLEPFATNQPFVAKYGGNVYAYYFGIIDFLQPWNLGKKVLWSAMMLDGAMFI